MNNNKLVLFGLAVLFLSAAALYGWTAALRLTTERCLEKAESLFSQAIEMDMEKREKELGSAYRFIYVPGEEDSIAQVETADTSLFVPKKKNYQDESGVAKMTDIIQLYLLEENPICVNKLDSLYRVLLKEHAIAAQTALRYATKEKTNYSCTDSSFYASAYKLEERKIGINKEIILQPFLQFRNGYLIARSADMYLLIGCFWGIAVGLLSWYVFSRKKQTAALSFSEPSPSAASAAHVPEPYVKIGDELKFDSNTGILIYNGQEYMLINYKLKLFVLFWENPGRFWSSEELQHTLWPDGLCTKDALSQTVRRLRKEIQDISPLVIENVRGKGYRLVICS